MHRYLLELRHRVHREYRVIEAYLRSLSLRDTGNALGLPSTHAPLRR
ncbi:hypothetical protein [Chitinimonas sp. BJYL2]|nr:hypothetical protein [Chitinimonas sp. BJYL2]